MEFIKDISNVFSEIEGDFKGEVFAAELIKSGLTFEQIFFKVLSSFRRSTNKDIESVKTDIADNKDQSSVFIELNREGLYDMLPEGLFHYKNNPKQSNDKEAILKEIKDTKDEERHARKFFETFENEFFQRRLQLELQERALLDPASFSANSELFYTLFGGDVQPGNHQILTLLNILPLVFHIRGDIVKIEYCLREVLKFDIKVVIDEYSVIEQFIGDMPVLGDALLGINTIAGDCFRSQEPVYVVNIYNITKEEMPSFFSTGNNYLLLGYLLNCVLYTGSKYKICLHLADNERFFYLDNGENICCYLNYDSYIRSTN